MKHVYKGPVENLSVNDKHNFSNNLIRSIPHSENHTTPRAIQLKNRSAIRGGMENRVQPDADKNVDVV